VHKVTGHIVWPLRGMWCATAWFQKVKVVERCLGRRPSASVQFSSMCVYISPQGLCTRCTAGRVVPDIARAR
jgi:hypothetical protein